MTASSLVDPTTAARAEPRPAPADSILAVDDVSVSYGRVEAVRRVSLTIPRGGIVTIIGANGAGKTTLLNAIAGVLATAFLQAREALEHAGQSLAGGAAAEPPGAEPQIVLDRHGGEQLALLRDQAEPVADPRLDVLARDVAAVEPDAAGGR